MEFNDFIITEEYQKLHPLKKQIIEELYKSSQNTTLEMLLPKVLHINKELKKRNLSFTKEESQMLIQILTQNMSESDRNKVNMLTSFL